MTTTRAGDSGKTLHDINRAVSVCSRLKLPTAYRNATAKTRQQCKLHRKKVAAYTRASATLTEFCQAQWKPPHLYKQYSSSSMPWQRKRENYMTQHSRFSRTCASAKSVSRERRSACALRARGLPWRTLGACVHQVYAQLIR